MFLSPGRLWLLALIPVFVVVYVLVQARRKRSAIVFTNLPVLSAVAPRRPGWRRHLIAALFLLAMTVMTVGYAQPTRSAQVPRDRATIMVAIDVSLSMMATDVAPSRVEAAKSAAKQFVRNLPARFNVGLVSFAGTASVVVAPTTDRTVVASAIDALQLARSTAIGEAVFACLQTIRSFDNQANLDPPPAHIVLMSDGDNTKGRTPDEAAASAKAMRVPVSTIAFGTAEGTVDIEGEAIPVPPSTSTLRALAAGTGGKAYEAPSASQLSRVYDTIGRSVGFRVERRESTTWYLGAALLLLLTMGGCSLSWFQRLP